MPLHSTHQTNSTNVYICADCVTYCYEVKGAGNSTHPGKTIMICHFHVSPFLPLFLCSLCRALQPKLSLGPAGQTQLNFKQAKYQLF